MINSSVVILIPHYNNLDGLYNSIRNINEDLNIDILIVDDGSETLPDLKYLERIYKVGKIMLLVNLYNQKITQTLNNGLVHLKQFTYKYVARLDCGDKWYSNKITKQVKYLEANPDVCLLGTWGNFCDVHGNKLFTYRPPVEYKDILKNLYGANQFIHPSVVYKFSIINELGYYPTEFPSCEDYAFFFLIAQQFKVANYPEILIDYEINPGGISISTRRRQIKSCIKLIAMNFNFSIPASVGLIKYFIYFIIPQRLQLFIKSRYLMLRSKCAN